MTDEELFKKLSEIADEEIMARNPKSIIDVGRDIIAASIADTAGAKPVAWRWRLTAEINGKQWGPGPWEYTIYPEKFESRALYEVEPLYLAATPAPSVADAAGAKPIYQQCIDPIGGTWVDVSLETYKVLGCNSRVLYENAIAAPPASSVADAHTCAQAVLDLRGMLLRLIKYEGMANDDATNKLYQKTTDALFAASRIKEGAPSVADAAGASEDARDAARYRWLRNEHFPTADKPPLAQVVWKKMDNRHWNQWSNLIDGNDLDRAIDDAISKEK